MTRLYWQQEWPMLSYSIYVVSSLYLTFLLPPERSPKVLASSLFYYCLYCVLKGLHNDQVVVILATFLGLVWTQVLLMVLVDMELRI